MPSLYTVSGKSHALADKVRSVAIDNGGAGYTSRPAVGFSGGSGTGAAGTAVLTPTSIAALTLTNGGSYGATPTVGLTGGGGGTGFAAEALLAPTTVAAGWVLLGGSGYTVATASIIGGGGTGATADVIIFDGAISEIVITNPGSGYTSTPEIVITGDGIDGNALIELTASPIASINLVSGGTGFTNVPGVTIIPWAALFGGSGGAATAVLTPTSVASITLTAPGAGYLTTPTVALTGGGGSGAVATAELYGTTLVDVPTDAVGLRDFERLRRNLVPDEVTFSQDPATLEDVPLFAEKTEVTIKRNGVQWFVGRVVEVPRQGIGGFVTFGYKLAGPFWYFENLVYQQIWPLDAAANSHLTSPATYRRAIAIAGLASTTGLRQNTKDFIVDVLDWLIASNTPAVIQYTGAELPAGFEVPFRRLDAPKCSEALRWILRYLADAVLWFDYSLSPPKLNMHRRAGATTIIFSVDDLAQCSLAPRHDLQLENLVIQFVTLNGAGKVVLNEDKDPVGATGKEWGSAVLTVDNQYEPIPAGLAANFRAGLSTLQYAGQIVIEDEECGVDVRPGHLVNLTDGPEAWETAAAQVQQVREEIDTGRTTIALGPPMHIRFDDLVEVLKLAQQSDELGGDVTLVNKDAPPIVLEAEVGASGLVPNATEIASSCAQAYVDASRKPTAGDVIMLYKDEGGGTYRNKFRAYIHEEDTAAGADAYVVGVTVGSVTKYAHITPLGMW